MGPEHPEVRSEGHECMCTRDTRHKIPHTHARARAVFPSPSPSPAHPPAHGLPPAPKVWADRMPQSRCPALFSERLAGDLMAGLPRVAWRRRPPASVEASLGATAAPHALLTAGDRTIRFQTCCRLLGMLGVLARCALYTVHACPALAVARARRRPRATHTRLAGELASDSKHVGLSVVAVVRFEKLTGGGVAVGRLCHKATRGVVWCSCVACVQRFRICNLSDPAPSGTYSAVGSGCKVYFVRASNSHLPVGSIEIVAGSNDTGPLSTQFGDVSMRFGEVSAQVWVFAAGNDKYPAVVSCYRTS